MQKQIDPLARLKTPDMLPLPSGKPCWLILIWMFGPKISLYNITNTLIQAALCVIFQSKVIWVILRPRTPKLSVKSTWWAVISAFCCVTAHSADKSLACVCLIHKVVLSDGFYSDEPQNQAVFLTSISLHALNNFHAVDMCVFKCGSNI